MSRAADVLFESSILILGRISQADILMYLLLHSQDNIALHSFVSCEQNRKKGKYFDHVTKMSHMKKYDEKVCSKGHKHENLIFVSQIIWQIEIVARRVIGIISQRIHHLGYL